LETDSDKERLEKRILTVEPSNYIAGRLNCRREARQAVEDLKKKSSLRQGDIGTRRGVYLFEIVVREVARSEGEGQRNPLKMKRVRSLEPPSLPKGPRSKNAILGGGDKILGKKGFST